MTYAALPERWLVPAGLFFVCAHEKRPAGEGGASSLSARYSPARRDQISDRLSSPSTSTSEA